MDPDEREVEDRLGDEVTVAHRVEAVVERLGEAEVGGVADRIDRQRRAGQRAGAEGRHIEPAQRVEQPIDVAPQRPPVREQVMRQQHGLSPLEMGVAGQVHPLGAERPVEERLLQVEHTERDRVQFAFAPQAQVGGHLVVATPGGVELAARRSCQFGHPTFDRRVDVLVGLDEHEVATLHLRRHLVECGEYRITLGLGQQTDPGETSDVGT